MQLCLACELMLTSELQLLVTPVSQWGLVSGGILWQLKGEWDMPGTQNATLHTPPVVIIIITQGLTSDTSLLMWQGDVGLLKEHNVGLYVQQEILLNMFWCNLQTFTVLYNISISKIIVFLQDSSLHSVNGISLRYLWTSVVFLILTGS